MKFKYCCSLSFKDLQLLACLAASVHIGVASVVVGGAGAVTVSSCVSRAILILVLLSVLSSIRCFVGNVDACGTDERKVSSNAAIATIKLCALSFMSVTVDSFTSVMIDWCTAFCFVTSNLHDGSYIPYFLTCCY